MQRPPLFESDGFIYWKNRFETYVKSKDLDLWHVITDGDFPPIQNNSETKKNEVVPFHKQNDDLKKKVAKNNEAKMAKKESTDEDSSTSYSEDEEYAMAVRDFKKFFKRRERFIRQPHDEIKSSQRNKDDKNDKSKRKCFKYGDPNHLIGECPKLSSNYNHRPFVGGSWSNSDEDEEENTKDEKCFMAKAYNKAKKESTDEDSLTSYSEDEEYAMAVRDFKKFFKRRGRFIRQPHNEIKSSQRNKDDKNDKSKRKCFKYGDP
nr:zf-CCHC domain-containing protein/DUF4219 domain-containing protein/UBN2 domain-containing protein [Tanacetum cinerariifolium]